MRKLIPLLLILCVASAGAQSARREVEKRPGYFDFGDIESFSDGDEMVEVDLMQPLLSLFAGVVEQEEPEMYSLLKNLELVNVRVFSYKPELETKLRTHIEDKSEQLRSKDWENVVKVRSKDENLNVFVKLSNAERGKPANPDTALEGLAILVVDEFQAVFVNVVGHFDMEAIQSLGKHFNLPHMDEINGQRKYGRDDEGR
jgi:hypothetical protein